MPKLHAVWVDDDWTTDGRRRQWLEDALTTLDQHLRDQGYFVEWEKLGGAAEAHVALSQREDETPDYRLAVLDCVFKDERWDWEVVAAVLQGRGIPFVFCSSFLDRVQPRIQQVVQERFLIGTVTKSEEGLRKLLSLVRGFFESPPIRLLHLSDFHFQHGLPESSEQEQVWKALFSTVEQEASQWPFDAVALTGDFAHHRPDRDLTRVRSYVKHLIVKTVGLSNLQRVFVVPGNHDLTWADFDQRLLAEQPWQPYLDFYQALFSGRQDVLAELGAWNGDTGLLDPDPGEEGLVWARWLPDLRIRVLGLASPTRLVEYQGRGVIGREQRARMQEIFTEPRIPGEVRLGLMHHNLFGVLSFGPHDDKRTVLAPGEVLQSLLRNGVQLLLCGHTHVSNVFGISAAKYQPREYGVVHSGTLTTVSAGTVGGLHGSLQLPRSFNIVEISSAKHDTGSRQVMLQAYTYDPSEQEWIRAKAGYSGRELMLGD